jgi:hypothetical protein
MNKLPAKTLLILILTAMSQFDLFGQLIDFNPKTIEEMKLVEGSRASKLTDSIAEFGILKNPHFDIHTLTSTKVYIYRQLDDDFDPQLHIWYHFAKSTNEFKGLRYNWGLYNPNFNPSKEINRLKRLTKKEKEFIEKFRSLQNEIERTFGKPVKSKTIEDSKESFIEEMFWETDELIIGLSIHFNRELTEIPFVGVLGDFHIEVMITDK